MMQSYDFDAAGPPYAFTFLNGAAEQSPREEGGVWNLDVETLVGPDAIRDRLGLASRGEGPESVVHSVWRMHGEGSLCHRTGSLGGDPRMHLCPFRTETCSPKEVAKSSIAALVAR